jgi:transposase
LELKRQATLRPNYYSLGRYPPISACTASAPSIQNRRYTIVRDYVRGEQLRSREMFVPLTHAPGEAQADLGEALAVIAGVKQKAHYLAMDLPHSDDCFVAAFPAQTTEAFLEGHVRAFAYFGGVPTRILYDNTKIAVARILGCEERQRRRVFSGSQSYYPLAHKFGRPAKADDEGKVADFFVGVMSRLIELRFSGLMR